MTSSVITQARSQYAECIPCQRKPCQRTATGTLDICEFGIAYYNTGDGILKKRERVTTRDIATNLRHELHRVLMYIVSQAEELDSDLSTKSIDLSRPASRIVGATVILDKFIEMVTGVYDFHPDRGGENYRNFTHLPLRDTILRLLDTYSLIKNRRRASTLEIKVEVPDKLSAIQMPSSIEHLIAILSDNIWKYSHPASKVLIRSVSKSDGLINLEFYNIGRPIAEGCPIFEKGYQAGEHSEGFGFGLYWAKVLVAHCNSATRRDSLLMTIRHQQKVLDSDDAQHLFVIENIAVEGLQ